jgi:hypothetical protein
MIGGSTGTEQINEDGLTIVKATYGVDTQFVDVTTEVRGLVQNGEIDFVVSAQSLGIPDPNPGSDKQILQIQYRLNGGHKNLDKFKSGEQVKLSAPNSKSSKKKVNHTWSFMQYVWSSIFFFFIGLLVIDAYKSGNYIFGYQSTSETGQIKYENVGAGVVLGLITLFSFGTSWIYIILPIALIFGFMRRSR